MTNPFHEKICVITGAGSGIGRALALDLAARGAALKRANHLRVLGIS